MWINIFNNTVTKDPTIPQVCRYMHYLVKCVLTATVENKMTSITTHVKKLTTGNNVFILSYCLQELCHTAAFTSQCSVCPPCCWTTHRRQLVRIQRLKTELIKLRLDAN